MLIAVGIIVFLCTLCMPVLSSFTKKGEMVREIQAGRTLATAYHAAAADNSGELLPGMDNSVPSVWFEPKKANISTFHVPARYPLRLAPYMDYKLRGTILLNNNTKQVAKMYPESNPMYMYVVTCYPTFGINYEYVGGLKLVDGEIYQASEVITRMAQVSGNSPLLFASGGDVSGTTHIDGYNILTPPYEQEQKWASAPWKPESVPREYGNVDARYDGKAVCVFLDGSVRLHTIEELRDMRLWNKNAAVQDDPDYRIPSSF